MKKIVIIGAGAMGSAFAVPCADNSNQVFLVGSFLEDKVIQEIKSLNNFHPILKSQLPKNIKVLKFSEFDNKIKENIDLLVVGVSSKGIQWIGDEISKFYKNTIDILLLTKGLAVIDDKFETLAEKLNKILINNGIKNSKISAVGGPCLANGLVNRINSSVVLANENLDIVKNIGKMISTKYYSIEYSNDLIGVEVCAAIKNLYSMIIGASEGLCSNNVNEDTKKKYFLNTAASLVYKSIGEMIYFTKKLNGKENTVYGLAGLGDLYVSSAGGRNSKMGKLLGEGNNYLDAKSKFMKNDTVEGAELIFEIGEKITKDFDRKKIPLMMALIDTIKENKKLKINW